MCNSNNPKIIRGLTTTDRTQPALHKRAHLTITAPLNRLHLTHPLPKFHQLTQAITTQPLLTISIITSNTITTTITKTTILIFPKFNKPLTSSDNLFLDLSLPLAPSISLLITFLLYLLTVSKPLKDGLVQHFLITTFC